MVTISSCSATDEWAPGLAAPRAEWSRSALGFAPWRGCLATASDDKVLGAGPEPHGTSCLLIAELLEAPVTNLWSVAEDPLGNA